MSYRLFCYSASCHFLLLGHAACRRLEIKHHVISDHTKSENGARHYRCRSKKFARTKTKPRIRPFMPTLSWKANACCFSSGTLHPNHELVLEGLNSKNFYTALGSQGNYLDNGRQRADRVAGRGGLRTRILLQWSSIVARTITP